MASQLLSSSTSFRFIVCVWRQEWDSKLDLLESMTKNEFLFEHWNRSKFLSLSLSPSISILYGNNEKKTQMIMIKNRPLSITPLCHLTILSHFRLLFSISPSLILMETPPLMNLLCLLVWLAYLELVGFLSLVCSRLNQIISLWRPELIASGLQAWFSPAAVINWLNLAAFQNPPSSGPSSKAKRLE